MALRTQHPQVRRYLPAYSSSKSAQEARRREKPILIHSVYIGQPQMITDAQGTWRSSIYRTQVEGPVQLEIAGLVGDLESRVYTEIGAWELIYGATYPQWQARYEASNVIAALAKAYFEKFF